MTELHMGDVGVAIEFDVVDINGAAFDVSTATLKQVRARKPDGDAAMWDAAFLNDGHNGKLVYITAAESDLDQEGAWRFQVYLEMPPNRKYHTNIVNRKIYANLPTQATQLLDAAEVVSMGQQVTIS